MSSRAFDFALTGNKGVKVFPDTTTLPNVNDVFTVASIIGNEVLIGTAASGGPYLPLAGGVVTGPLNLTATGGTTSRSVQDHFAEVINVKRRIITVTLSRISPKKALMSPR